MWRLLCHQHARLLYTRRNAAVKLAQHAAHASARGTFDMVCVQRLLCRSRASGRARVSTCRHHRSPVPVWKCAASILHKRLTSLLQSC